MILISLHMLQPCQPLAPSCCFAVSPIVLAAWITLTGAAPQPSPLHGVAIPSALPRAPLCLRKLLPKRRLRLIKMHPPGRGWRGAAVPGRAAEREPLMAAAPEGAGRGGSRLQPLLPAQQGKAEG